MLASLPDPLVLTILNKTDEVAFIRFRCSSKNINTFVENNRAAIKVKILAKYQLQLTSRVIDIYRKRRISMDTWDSDDSIKSALIGFKPKFLTLRKPVGPKVLEVIRYYNLKRCPFFFHDLEVDSIVPILSRISPITIRVSNDKEAYDQRLLSLNQIKNAKRVRFDFFLGLNQNTHSLLLQHVHELHIGFTDPIPLLFIRELMANFWNAQSVIDFLDLYTFLDVSPKVIIKRLLVNISQEAWTILPTFTNVELTSTFPFFNMDSHRTPYCVAEIRQRESEKRGVLFVSYNRIMFVTTNG